MQACRTEIGVVAKHMALAHPMSGGRWAYFSISPAVEYVLSPQQNQPGVFELVILVRIQLSHSLAIS